MVWLCYSLFNYSSFEGHLSWFQFLAATAQAAMNIHIHRSGSGKANVRVIHENKIRSLGIWFIKDRL